MVGAGEQSMSKQDTGIVDIHGKSYQTVAYRVGKFREIHGFDLSLTTEIVARTDEYVVMKAVITNAEGRVLATGHSEEYRSDGRINATSALENSETSAIGRALASLGIGGTEFASADEVARAVSGQKSGVIKPTDGAFDRCAPARRKVVMDSVALVQDYLSQDQDFDAYAICEGFTDPDEKVALWSFLDSKQRKRLKAQAEVANRKAA
jgi:hypothetical protein